MKVSISISAILLCICSFSFAQNNSTANLKTFAKAYGYVKYFHPSDEALKIDWNNFAAYGAERIYNCASKEEVIQTLNEIFNPIGPGIVFANARQEYDLNMIIPEDLSGYEATYWQHLGVSEGMSNQSDTYQSVRVNRYTEIDESHGFGNLESSTFSEKYIGKEIKLSGWVKLNEGSKGTGHLWLRVDKSDDSKGFFNNMNANPISGTEWEKYEIIGAVDSLADNVNFGCMIIGKGTVHVDDIKLHYKEGSDWIEIPIENSGFEDGPIGVPFSKSKWKTRSKGYAYSVDSLSAKEGEKYASIAYEGKFRKIKPAAPFDAQIEFGEIIEKEIGDGIFCQIPLSLYGNDKNTYPASSKIELLQNEIINLDDNLKKLSVRLGNVVITYNVFQHFYPYFDVVDVNWEKELEKAIERTYADQNELDHKITLEKFTAPLRDGHIWVNGGKRDSHAPPFAWEIIEDKLVIIKVYEDNLDFGVGDIVTEVNGIASEKYLEEIYSRISAGTNGYKLNRAKFKSFLGTEASEISIKVKDKTYQLSRDREYDYFDSGISIQENKYTVLDDGIVYLNLGKIPMSEIEALLPDLEQANGIICDLRGYPKGNHGFIPHLLSEKDNSTSWMRVPQFIYPDQENLVGYENHGWELEPATPYLGDKKIVFIIDGRAISYAESYMSFIEGYNLATIVGQPTAGANGNVNPFPILGGFRITWTGMKVVKHDGSQHHGVGVLPDIYVEKTIKGVKEGRDEFLERAIEVFLE